MTRAMGVTTMRKLWIGGGGAAVIVAVAAALALASRARDRMRERLAMSRMVQRMPGMGETDRGRTATWDAVNWPETILPTALDVAREISRAGEWAVAEIDRGAVSELRAYADRASADAAATNPSLVRIPWNL